MFQVDEQANIRVLEMFSAAPCTRDATGGAAVSGAWPVLSTPRQWRIASLEGKAQDPDRRRRGGRLTRRMRW